MPSNHRSRKPGPIEKSNNIILDTRDEGRHEAALVKEDNAKFRTETMDDKNADTTAETKGNEIFITTRKRLFIFGSY